MDLEQQLETVIAKSQKVIEELHSRREDYGRRKADIQFTKEVILENNGHELIQMVFDDINRQKVNEEVLSSAQNTFYNVVISKNVIYNAGMIRLFDDAPVQIMTVIESYIRSGFFEEAALLRTGYNRYKEALSEVNGNIDELDINMLNTQDDRYFNLLDKFNEKLTNYVHRNWSEFISN